MLPMHFSANEPLCLKFFFRGFHWLASESSGSDSMLRYHVLTEPFFFLELPASGREESCIWAESTGAALFSKFYHSVLSSFICLKL
jgi:hypothetical protein